LSGVWTAATGTAYSVGFSYQNGGGNVNLTGSPDYAARARVVGDPGSGCSSNPLKQFNTAAFQGPAVGSVGLESGAGYLRGCFTSAFDVAIARTIRLGGNRNIQIRAEMYNAPNSAIITNRNTTLNLNSPSDPVLATNLPYDSNGNVVAARSLPRGAGFGVATEYRGIIQQAAWSGRGTYLRKKIEQYQLDKVFRHGRIWRLTYDGMERDKTQPRMLDETPAQLVAHLSHPNGWWRDTAQQLLVSRGHNDGPSLVGSPRILGHRDYVIKTLLHGMTGPLEGRTYPAGVMMPLGDNTEQWIAAIASYVRNSFGNRSSFVTPDHVARVRSATGARNAMWTPEELEASLPRLMLAQSTWTLMASHNPSAAPGALTFTTLNSGAPQEPGMWFQVELPEAARLTEIHFDSPGRGGRGGGGGRGRGASGGTGAPGTMPPGDAASPSAASAPQGSAPQAGAQGAGGAAPGGVPTPGQVGPAGQAGPPAVTQPPSAYPRGYKVEVSMDGDAWTPVAEGKGAGPSTMITFDPVRAKFVRITQTATLEGTTPWSIQRLRLYEVADGK